MAARGSIGLAAVALAALLALGAAAPGAAGAAEPIGSATLTVGKGKWRALGKRGISLAALGRADRDGRRLRLAVRGGEIGEASARLAYAGALRLSARHKGRRRAVKLRALRVELGARSRLTAKLGKKRRVVFDLRGGALAIERASGSARLLGARLRWRRGALRTIERRLRARLPGRVLGKLRASAATVLEQAPKSGPIQPQGPPPARPASAVDVTAATLTWHVRDSWIRYLNTEQAPQPIEGAVAAAPIAEDDHPCPNRPAGTNPTLVYSYGFPFQHGWYDPSSGSAALYHGGGVRFSYPSHGIEITARSPEIEIGGGGASRATFRLHGAGQTPYPDQRAALLDLTPGVPGATGPGAYGFAGPLRGTLTADGQAVFAGFYPPPEDGFGCFSVSFATG